MPGSLVPNQMFDHSLNVVKGPSLMHRLDKDAAPAAGQSDIFEGMLVSLNNAGAMVKGCDNGEGANRPMPMFAIQGIDDFDANSDVGNISGGVMSAVVATGGFEIETTEFVAGGNTFACNDLLTGASATDLGKVTKATEVYGAETICGVVSSTALVSGAAQADKLPVLTFWSVYLPAGEDVTE